MKPNSLPSASRERGSATEPRAEQSKPGHLPYRESRRRGSGPGPGGRLRGKAAPPPRLPLARRAPRPPAAQRAAALVQNASLLTSEKPLPFPTPHSGHTCLCRSPGSLRRPAHPRRTPALRRPSEPCPPRVRLRAAAAPPRERGTGRDATGRGERTLPHRSRQPRRSLPSRPSHAHRARRYSPVPARRGAAIGFRFCPSPPRQRWLVARRARGRLEALRGLGVAGRAALTASARGAGRGSPRAGGAALRPPGARGRRTPPRRAPAWSAALAFPPGDARCRGAPAESLLPQLSRGQRGRRAWLRCGGAGSGALPGKFLLRSSAPVPQLGGAAGGVGPDGDSASCAVCGGDAFAFFSPRMVGERSGKTWGRLRCGTATSRPSQVPARCSCADTKPESQRRWAALLE